MSLRSFPLKDLRRRKRHTALSVSALSLVVTGATFVMITSENLDIRIRSMMEGKLNVGFLSIFFDFTNLMIIFSVLTGVVITYFLTSISMSERRRDIGIMKSVGCLPSIVFGHFAAELCMVVFSSCAIGTSLGVLSSFVYVGLGSFSLSERQIVVSPWPLMLFSLVFIIISLFLGIQPIVKAIQTKSSVVLMPRLSRDLRIPNAFTAKRSLSFRIASRALLRRGYNTALMIVCFALVIILTTMMVAGAIIVGDTTQSYIGRAIGENVILISHPDISSKYIDLLSFSSRTGAQMPDFLNSKYQISGTLVSRLGSVPGVTEVDPRIVFEAQVYEVQGVAFVGEDVKQVLFLGDHRSSTAVVQGIEPEHVVNGCLMWGKTINESDLDSVILGDTLNSRIISYPSEQKIEISGKRFEIAGVALDPFNAGFVVYAPLSSISQLTNQTEHNTLLLKVDSSRYSDTLKRIEAELSGSDLEYIELDKIIEDYVAFFDFIWSPYVPLSLLFLSAAIFCLFSYTSHYVAEQEADFGIMRALGTKPSKIITIVLVENVIITLLGGVTGAFIGFSVVFCFLMPSPVISYGSLISVIVWLFLGLGLFCVSGLYSAFRALGKSAAYPKSHLH